MLCELCHVNSHQNIVCAEERGVLVICLSDEITISVF